MSLMVSVSGVRGVVGKELTPELLVRYASAFARFSNKGTVMVGRDTRPTGNMAMRLVTGALMASGCRVIEAGIASTPAVQMAVKHLKLAGGVIVTASHNPVEWNALKFVGPGGFFLSKKENERFLPLAQENALALTDWRGVPPRTERFDANELYVNKILGLKLIHVSRLKKRRFHVVLDAVNGAGSLSAPRLLEALGCRVTVINGTPDGLFPHPPEPVPAHLAQLCRAVRKSGADVGFALDPDADRLAIVSEEARAIGEEYTLALCGDHLLKKRRGWVVVNLSTSRMIEDIAEKYGSRVARAPVGEINVANLLIKKRGVFGGEGNGGAMLPDLHPCRDAGLGMAVVLMAMLESRKTISGLAGEIPRYHLEKQKAGVAGVNMEKAFRRIEKAIPGKIDRQDGLRIDLGDAWIQFRKSNTEPIVRIFAECSDAGQARALCARAAALLK